MKQYIFENGNLVKTIDERSLEKAIQLNIEVIREKVSQVLFAAGLDTSTQQNAALGIYSPERCEAIKLYIAACRNEYLRCKTQILASTTNDEADSVTFIAPPVEENL